MSYRQKLAHDMSDVLGALDRALVMYEQMATEMAVKRNCASMDSRMKLLRTFTENIVEQVQAEIFKKAGYDGTSPVRVVRRESRPGASLPVEHVSAIKAPIPVPQRRGGWSRRPRAGVARTA